MAVDLETVRENLEYMLEAFGTLDTPIGMDGEYADACLLAWRRSRQLAIAILLTEADSSSFFSWLVRAAELRRDFLAATVSNPVPFTEYRHVGDLAGFVDALAAGRIDLAAEIARLSQDPWSPDFEYEDDYWFAKSLHALVSASFAPDANCQRALGSLRNAAEGESTPQVQLVAALLARDADNFRRALTARVAEYRKWFARKGEGVVANPDEYATERHVFVEGLALKVLAGKMSIELADEEPLMPRESRLTTNV
jgi:hypothetical protein